MKYFSIFFRATVIIAIGVILTSSSKRITTELESGALLPDLQVMAINSNENPCYGDNRNIIKVTVSNSGAGYAKGEIPVRIKIYPSGTEIVQHYSKGIPPGHFRVITFKRINLTKGDNRLQTAINHPKKIDETNYKNNGKTRSLKALIHCDNILSPD